MLVARDFEGKFWVKPDMRIGYLAQEPVLDSEKNVHGNIMDVLKEKTDLLTRMDELAAAMGDPDADMDAVRARKASAMQLPLRAVRRSLKR